jgi:hypothetical protein
MVVPDLSSGPLQHVAVAAGKDGRLFIMDRDNLGGFHTPDVSKNVPIDHCLCGPSYFEAADGQPRIVSSGGNTLRTWKVNTSQSPRLRSRVQAPSTHRLRRVVSLRRSHPRASSPERL